MNSPGIHLRTTDMQHFLLSLQGFLMLILIFILAGAQALNAQSGERAPVRGERVKIKAPTVKRGNLVGRVTNTSSNVLTIATEDTSFTLAYTSIKKISVYDGTKRNIGKGMLWGAAAGGLVLGTVAMINNKPAKNTCDENPGWFCDGFFDFTDGEAFAIGAVAGAFLGGVGGGVIGALIRTPRWKEVPVDISFGMPPVPAYATAGGNGRSFRAGVSLRFSLNGKR